MRATGEEILNAAQEVVQDSAHPDPNQGAIKSLQDRQRLALERTEALDLALPTVIDNGNLYGELAGKQAGDINKYLKNGMIYDELPALEAASTELPDLAGDPLPEWMPRANSIARKPKLYLFRRPGPPGPGGG